MCGIAGIFAYHDAAASPGREELCAIRDRMTARGPDGAGDWWSEDGRLGLAHRRLSILDLSDRAAQPMRSADGRYCVTFNGEIYNHPELKRELEADGVAYSSGSDTETLLHLFARYGEAMLAKLRGMYAFAVWDVAERRLFLARDPYGIKPLYIANDGWTMRFASQVKALLASAEVSRDTEPAGLVGFHLWGHVPEPFTLYREIRALPAGHCQWVDRRGAHPARRHFGIADTLAAGRRVSAQLPLDERRLAACAAARDSVRAHLLADVEVGVFLSAGVDSGAVLGVVSEQSPKPALAITLAFDEFSGSDEDEAPLAAEVAHRYGARHVVRRVGESEFATDLPAILDAMDQPSIDGINTWFVAKAAREAGLKVALSGLGGDELLAGYPSFRELPGWRRKYGWPAGLPWLGCIASALLPRCMPKFDRRQPKAKYMLSYAGSDAGRYLLKRGLRMPQEIELPSEILREGLRRLRPLRHVAASLQPDPGSDVGRICAMESSHYMRDQLLRDADWAGMAHGLEIRTPLVDSHLLRAVAPILADLQHGAGKRLLAQLPTRPLPEAVLSRAKTGFATPTSEWMRHRASQQWPAVQFETKGEASRHWSNWLMSHSAWSQPTLGGPH